MPVIFPPVESASDEGLLAVGGNLDVETLLAAYSQGIFPWPVSKDSPLTWFSPDPRGVLATEDFHISKSFKKAISKNPFTIKFNQSFKEVVEKCYLTDRKHEEGTWITNDIIEGYTNFFNAGYAYSVEAYLNEKLVGGVYGVSIGHYISGESMFYEETNASKICLYSLIEKMKENGISRLDTQMVTPVISTFGGKLIPREIFIQEVKKNIKVKKTREQIFNHVQD